MFCNFWERSWLVRYLLYLSYFSCKYGPFGKSREGEGEDTLGFINSNLEKDFKGSVRQLSFYLRNSLCMELFREFKFPFPNPSLNYCFFYCVRKHLCISWTCELQFWKSTRFSVCQPRLFPTASIRGFKALSKSNYDIIWRKAKITRHRGLDFFGVKRRKTSVSKLVSNCIVA